MLCVSARLGVVALLGLQRAEQREQLQWPVRVHLCGGIAKVGFGRKPALYPARAESRLFDMALKLSKMV